MDFCRLPDGGGILMNRDDNTLMMVDAHLIRIEESAKYIWNKVSASSKGCLLTSQQDFHLRRMKRLIDDILEEGIKTERKLK